ncbi:MAG TPA: ferritin-like domain-containing protein [Chloroflexota bacterium]|nr:ferritin-like domain-containing protein [Chloroflexota bacterium]
MAVVESLTSYTTSRRGFFKITGAAGLGLALAQAGTLSALAASDESIQNIIDIAATAEALAVTLTGAVLAGAAKYDGGKGLSPLLVTVIKAIQAEEQDHYTFLTGAGAKPLTLTFTVPQNLLAITNDSKALLNFVQAAETIFIGAYLAAAQEFTNLGHPELSQIAYQIGGVECEHRVLANFGLGISPPNNLGFEQALYHNVAEAAAAVKQLGLLGTPNPAATLSYSAFSGSVDHTGIGHESP